jgi:hypothetical protein
MRGEKVYANFVANPHAILVIPPKKKLVQVKAIFKVTKNAEF